MFLIPVVGVEIGLKQLILLGSTKIMCKICVKSFDFNISGVGDIFPPAY